MTTTLIKTLIPYLPRYAEEQGDFYAVSTKQLITVLSEQAQVEYAIAENTVAICELILDSLACLNMDYLARHQWCFVSFPAQLMALSVLTAMSDKDSRFFEARKNQPHFWNTHNIDNDQKEQQRQVLKTIEQQRETYHLHNATPIRFIYAAWSVIKIDDNILFYQREDTQKRHDKQAGDYGLVGGRVNQYDLDSVIDEMTERLQCLQSPNLEQIKPAFEKTLIRELKEETGLIYGEHYQFKLWRDLKPYQQVQGVAPNHALTEYFLSLYQIDLSLQGFFFLQQQLEKNEQLAWFSLNEMVAGKTVDGKIAYINALFNDFEDKTALKQALLDLSPSFVANYQFSQKNYAVTLPINAQQPIMAGNLGKAKVIESSLTEQSLALLLGLAAHLRGFQFLSLEAGVNLHAYGWIEVATEQVILIERLTLLSTLDIAPLVIEIQDAHYFRLSMQPNNVFFNDALFQFILQGNDLTVQRMTIKTALGCVSAMDSQHEITITMSDNLKAIQKGEGEDYQLGNYKKSPLHQAVLKLGMQSMIKMEAKKVKLCGVFC